MLLSSHGATKIGDVILVCISKMQQCLKYNIIHMKKKLGSIKRTYILTGTKDTDTKHNVTLEQVIFPVFQDQHNAQINDCQSASFSVVYKCIKPVVTLETLESSNYEKRTHQS